MTWRVALAQWEGRDDSKPQPDVRRAANEAVDAIDLVPFAGCTRVRAR